MNDKKIWAVYYRQPKMETIMEFKVLNENGICVMSTTHVSCIPDEEQLKDMAKFGYKFKLDGKAISVKKIKEFLLTYVK